MVAGIRRGAVTRFLRLFGGALRFLRSGLLGLRLGFLLGLQRFGLLLQLGQTGGFGSSLGIAQVRGGLGHDLLSFGLLGLGIGNGFNLFIFFLVQVVESVVKRSFKLLLLCDLASLVFLNRIEVLHVIHEIRDALRFEQHFNKRDAARFVLLGRIDAKLVSASLSGRLRVHYALGGFVDLLLELFSLLDEGFVL